MAELQVEAIVGRRRVFPVAASPVLSSSPSVMFAAVRGAIETPRVLTILSTESAARRWIVVLALWFSGAACDGNDSHADGSAGPGGTGIVSGRGAGQPVSGGVGGSSSSGGAGGGGTLGGSGGTPDGGADGDVPDASADGGADAHDPLMFCDRCDDLCVDLDSDEDNCGTCGHSCAPPMAQCVDGACAPVLCEKGSVECTASETCCGPYCCAAGENCCITAMGSRFCTTESTCTVPDF